MRKPILLLIITTMLLAIGCMPKKDKAEQKEEPVVVKLGQPQRMDLPDLLSYVGEIKGRKEASLSFGVGGIIDKIQVVLGQYVQKGELLGQLRQGQFASALSQARIGYKQLQKDLERQEALYTDGMVAETQIEKLRNAVEQAKAGLVMAEENLALSRITAPFSGYIATKRGETGESFSPMGGPPIITLVDYSTVKIKIGVAEKDLGKVKKGQKTTFTVAAYPEREFKGRVSRIGMTLHPMNRTAEVEVTASNPGRVLKSGMMATVEILLGLKKDCLVVPDNIVRREMGLTTLFVANGLQARLANVKVGVTHNEHVEIIEGLTKADSIIIDGHLMVKDGNPLKITKTKTE